MPACKVKCTQNVGCTIEQNKLMLSLLCSLLYKIPSLQQLNAEQSSVGYCSSACHHFTLWIFPDKIVLPNMLPAELEVSYFAQSLNFLVLRIAFHLRSLFSPVSRSQWTLCFLVNTLVNLQSHKLSPAIFFDVTANHSSIPALRTLGERNASAGIISYFRDNLFQNDWWGRVHSSE